MPFAPHSAPGASTTARRLGYWTLFVCLVNNGVSNSMLFALLPPVARQTGISEWAIASTFIVAAALFTVMSQVWGALSDQVGRRPLIILGLCGSAVSTLIMAQSISWVLAGAVSAATAGFLIIGSRAVFGLVNSASGPAAMAWVADRSTPQTRTAAISTLTAALGLGAAAGPSVGALMTPFVGLAGPFVVTGLLSLAGAVAVGVFLPERTPPASRERRTITSSLSLIHDVRLRDIVLISCGAWLVQAVGLQIVGFAVLDRFALTGVDAVTAAGTVLSGGALASLIAQAVIIPRFKLMPRQAMLVGVGLAGVGSFGLALATDLRMMAVVFAIQGFGLGLARASTAAAASLAVEPHEQGAAAGLVAATAGMGFFVSAWVGTGLYSVAGAGASFIGASLVAAAAFALATTSTSVVRASRRAGEQRPPPEEQDITDA